MLASLYCIEYYVLYILSSKPSETVVAVESWSENLWEKFPRMRTFFFLPVFLDFLVGPLPAFFQGCTVQLSTTYCKLLETLQSTNRRPSPISQFIPCILSINAHRLAQRFATAISKWEAQQPPVGPKSRCTSCECPKRSQNPPSRDRPLSTALPETSCQPPRPPD